LHEPPARFTVDVERNRASIRRVAALEPELVVFGHGPALRDAAGPLAAFAAALPDEEDRPTAEAQRTTARR
jgi:glyoxylase-like metal-dependent hydrolase (beta-lactamase superfamily II)